MNSGSESSIVRMRAAEDRERVASSDTGRRARDRLLALGSALENFESVLIYSHMNPDPDTVGSALALRLLLKQRFNIDSTVCYRGMIGRAENRELMRTLGRDMVHAAQVDQDDYGAALLVDCQPDYGLLPGKNKLPIIGVIDHHPISPSSSGITFTDVRPDYGSTSTILVEYLQSADIEPDPVIATALFYGLKTDTQDLSRRTEAPDVAAYDWLQSRIDRPALSKIENPPRTREYFQRFTGALGRAVVYKKTVITELGSMPYTDMVAEIADRMLQLEGMRWAVCFGTREQRIYLSVRTSHPTRDAGTLVKSVLQGDGVGGGHDTMAAGRVQLLEDSEETYVRKVSELWRRFLDELGEEPGSGRRLVDDCGFALRIEPETI